MNKKSLIICSMLLLLFSINLGNLSATSFTRSIDYSKEDLREVTFKNWWGLGGEQGKVFLSSHEINDKNEIVTLQTGLGWQVKMYYDFTWNEYTSNVLNDPYFIDMETGKRVERDWYYVYWGKEVRERETYETICKEEKTDDRRTLEEKMEDYEWYNKNCETKVNGTELYLWEGWMNYNSRDIPKGDIRIGIMTYTDKKEYVDGVWVLGSKELTAHATWNSSLENGLLRYYFLDEISGTNVFDWTGNENATANNESIFTSEITGIINTGADFSQSNSHIINGTHGLGTGNVNYTYSLWFNKLSMSCGNGADYPLIWVGSGTTRRIAGFVLTGDAGTNCRFKSLHYADDQTFSWVVPANTWYYATLVHYTNRTVELYINGVYNESKLHSGDLALNNNFLGIGSDNSGRFYNGYIDEVMIYNRTLSYEEIQLLYNEGDGLRPSSEPVDNPPTVTLNSPANDSTQLSSSVTFNCSAYDDINLTNVSLMINGSINQTNSSGINNTNYIFTVDNLAETSYNWNCYACDNNSQCATATTNRTFSVSIPVTINVVSPINDTYGVSSITFNATSNKEIDTWIVNFNGTNYTITLGDSFNLDNGVYNLLFYGNDSSGKWGVNDSVVFSVDVNTLIITMDSPLNQTYNYTSINLNVSANKDAENWKYSLNGNANQTFSPNVTITGTEGQNTIIVYADDVVESTTHSLTRLFRVDTTPPEFTTIPANASLEYLVGTLNVEFVAEDISGISYWWINDTTNFQITQDGILTNKTIFGAGEKEVIVYVNDTLNNINSVTYKVTTTQNTGNCEVLFSETSPLTYPDNLFNVYSDCTSAFTIYRNGSIISNNSEQNLGAGSYNFTVVRTDTINYSNVYDEKTFIINKGTLSGTITNTEDWSIEYPTEITIGYSESNVGDGDVTYTIYRDGELIGTGETITLGIGTYEYILNSTGGANYSANSEINKQTLIVSDETPPIINVLSPLNITYLTNTIAFNAEANEEISSWIVNYNGTNVSVETISLNLQVEDGNYNLKIYANDTSGNWGLNDSIWFSVKATPPEIIINSGEGVIDYWSSNVNHTINFTVNDNYLDNCHYYYPSINSLGIFSSKLMENLVSYYNFENYSGMNLIDIFGSNNGVSNNLQVFDTEGKIFLGADFNGGDYQIDFDYSVFNLTEGSISGWFKWSEDDTVIRLLTSPDSLTFRRPMIYKSDENNIFFRLDYYEVTNPYIGYFASTENTFLKNEWHHILVTWKEYDTLCIYVNGGGYGNYNCSPLEEFTKRARFTLGRYLSTYYNYNVDELTMWDKQIGPEYASLLYNSNDGRTLKTRGTNFTCNNGEVGLISLNSLEIENTLDIYSEDEFGNINSKLVEWSYNILEHNRTYESSVQLGKETTYSVGFDAGVTVSKVELIYDGDAYEMNKVNDNQYSLTRETESEYVGSNEFTFRWTTNEGLITSNINSNQVIYGIEINQGEGVYDYGYVGKNHTIGFTIINEDLENVWYLYNYTSKSSFESDSDGWNNVSGWQSSFSRSTEWSSDGNYSLKLSALGGFASVSSYIYKKLDLTDINAISFDLNVSQYPINPYEKVQILYKTGEDCLDFQFSTYSIFKEYDTVGIYNQFINTSDLDGDVCVAFSISSGFESGRDTLIYVDNIRLFKDINIIEGAIDSEQNTTNISVEKDKYDVLIYAIDTNETLMMSKINWNYIIFVNDLDYSSSTFELAYESFIINLTYTQSAWTSITAILNYDNINYTATSVTGTGNDRIFERNLNIPAVSSPTSKEFYWIIRLTNSTGEYFITTQTLSQAISEIEIDSCGVFATNLLNFTWRDEETQELMNFTNRTGSVEIALSLYGVGNGEGSVTFNTSYNNTNNARVCLNNSLIDGNLYLDAKLKYFADNYTIRYYHIQRALINSSSIGRNITLYSLEEEKATTFIIYYKGVSFNTVPGVLIDISREYISEDAFKTIEIPMTDIDGKATASLIKNSQVYTFNVYENGTLVSTFQRVIPVCANEIIGDCRINLNAYSSTTRPENFLIKDDLRYTISYNESTKTITLNYATITGEPSIVKLQTLLFDNFGNNTICDSEVNSASGTLTCVIPDSYLNKTAIINIFRNNEFISRYSISLKTDPSTIFGYSGYFLALIMIIVIPFMFITSLVGMVIGAMIGVIAMSLLLLKTGANLYSITGGIVWFIIAGMVLLWKLNSQDGKV